MRAAEAFPVLTYLAMARRALEDFNAARDTSEPALFIATATSNSQASSGTATSSSLSSSSSSTSASPSNSVTPGCVDEETVVNLTQVLGQIPVPRGLFPSRNIELVPFGIMDAEMGREVVVDGHCYIGSSA